MRVGTLPDGARGFDANSKITADAARALRAHGYAFAVRYVRRSAVHSYDLSKAEVDTILGAGLGLMIVQHVAPEDWVPTPTMGDLYGHIAAQETLKLGIPAGVTVWCDLEGVKSGTPHADVIGFCNAWYAAVKAAGFDPGLYVGFGAGLTAEELYRTLHFKRYWGAYNLNADGVPAVRGLQMRQLVAKASDLIPGFTNQNLDVDVIKADALGGTPAVLLP